MKRWISVVGICAIVLGCFWPASRIDAGAIRVGGNVVITDAGLNGEKVQNPVVAVKGNAVYAVWTDTRDSLSFDANYTIYFAKSSDGGKTWDGNVRISNIAYDSWCDTPQLAIAPDGTIWVAWYLFYQPGSNQTNEIRVAKSSDGGQTFTVKTVVAGFPDAEDRWLPQIAVDDTTGNLLLLYNEYSENGSSIGYDLYLHVFNTQLQKLSETTVNDQPRSGKVGDGLQDGAVPKKSLAVKNGVVCAAWEDQRLRYTIHGACSGDGGKAFGANFPISEADGLFPQLDLTNDGRLYATYYLKSDSRNNVLLRASPDRGKSWGASLNVTKLTTRGEVRRWAFKIDNNGQLLVGWVNKVGSGVSDVLLATSIDQGQNWATLAIEDETGKYPSAADHYDVALAVDGTGVATVAQLIWTDTRNVQTELFGQPLVLDSIPPTAPSNLQATGGDNSTLLTWDASTDATGIQGYRVYRSTAAGGPYTELTPRLVRATTYRDVELDGTTYFYKVAAVDGTANTGPTSGEVSAAAQVKSALLATGAFAYESNKEIHVRNFADLATDQVLAKGARPRFSADGLYLYYVVDNSILAQKQAGGDIQTVYSAKDLFDDYDIASFDPTNRRDNEQYIAAIIGRGFGSIGPVSFCFVSEPHYFSTGQQRFVDDYNYSSEIALSAYPQWLAYRYTGFCNTVAVGSATPSDLNIVNLTNNQKLTLSGVDIRDVDFAPARNDNRLVFAASFTGQYELWKAEIDEQGNLRNYVQLTRGASGIVARQPSWSSDGNWVIFQRDVDPGQTEDLQLYLVRADGAALRRLNVKGTRPTWAGGGTVDVSELRHHIYLPTVKR